MSADKPKQAKKDKGPNKEEVLKKFSSLLEDMWKGDVDVKAAIETYREQKIPDKFCKDVIVSGLNTALNKTGKLYARDLFCFKIVVFVNLQLNCSMRFGVNFIYRVSQRSDFIYKL